jgi:hypothetical protein
MMPFTSVISLCRRQRTPQYSAVRQNLPGIAESLAAGSIVTIEPTRVRIRALPLKTSRSSSEG